MSQFKTIEEAFANARAAMAALGRAIAERSAP